MDFIGAHGDDDGNDGGAWEGMGSPSSAQEVSSDLVAAPRQVARISVTYANAAKQVVQLCLFVFPLRSDDVHEA